MDAITRSVLGDILKAFAAAALATTLVMTFGGALQEGLRKGLPPQVVLAIAPYIVPEMLRYTLPGCLLLAACLAYGRLAAANELTALKALGVSPWQTLWPALAIGFFVSLGSVAMYDVCATWARPGLRQTVVESLQSIAYGVLRTERSFHTDGLSITVKEVDDDWLVQPVILVAGDDTRPAVTLAAEQAQLICDRLTLDLRLVCRNGQIDVAGRGVLWFPETIEHTVPYGESVDVGSDSAPAAALGWAQLPGQSARAQQRIDRLRAAAAAQAADDPEQADHLLRQATLHERRLHRLHAERQRRLANGFSCLFFVLVGAPAAIWWRHGDTLSIFFACFLPILLVYYPLLVIGEQLATSGRWPIACVWLPNAALLVIGLALLRPALR